MKAYNFAEPSMRLRSLRQILCPSSDERLVYNAMRLPMNVVRGTRGQTRFAVMWHMWNVRGR